MGISPGIATITSRSEMSATSSGEHQSPHRRREARARQGSWGGGNAHPGFRPRDRPSLRSPISSATSSRKSSWTTAMASSRAARRSLGSLFLGLGGEAHAGRQARGDWLLLRRRNDMAPRRLERPAPGRRGSVPWSAARRRGLHGPEGCRPRRPRRARRPRERLARCGENTSPHYNAEAARQALSKVLEWTGRHLG